MTAVPTLPPLPTRSLRRGDAAALLRVLEDQQARKLDLVVPGTALYSEAGRLRFTDTGEQALTSEGFIPLDGHYALTDTAIGHLAADYTIPVAYLRRCRTSNIRAFDHTINDWSRFDTGRNALVRMLWGHDPDQPSSSGIVRAVLSDGYGFRDNLDMATAFLAGVRAAGIEVEQIVESDLTDNSVYMRVSAPQIAVAAPALLRDYRSPFTGELGKDCPIVHAGVVFRNSETGQGATSVCPEIRIQVCDNGMTITEQALTQIHRGTQLAPGAVKWKTDTHQAEDTALILKIRDAVAAFLTPEFLQAQVDDITGAAAVTLREPETTVTVVTNKLSFTKDERIGVWKHFLQGGDQTAGGVMHAVTSYAQVLADNGRIDRGHEFNDLGIKALRLAATHA